jgi:hypothetical protein
LKCLTRTTGNSEDVLEKSETEVVGGEAKAQKAHTTTIKSIRPVTKINLAAASGNSLDKRRGRRVEGREEEGRGRESYANQDDKTRIDKFEVSEGRGRGERAKGKRGRRRVDEEEGNKLKSQKCTRERAMIQFRDRMQLTMDEQSQSKFGKTK